MAEAPGDDPFGGIAQKLTEPTAGLADAESMGLDIDSLLAGFDPERDLPPIYAELNQMIAYVHPTDEDCEAASSLARELEPEAPEPVTYESPGKRVKMEATSEDGKTETMGRASTSVRGASPLRKGYLKSAGAGYSKRMNANKTNKRQCMNVVS